MNEQVPLTVEEEGRYLTESDVLDGPSEQDMQDYLTGNLLTERPTV